MDTVGTTWALYELHGYCRNLVLSELGAVRTGHCQNRALSELHEYCRNYMGTVGTGHCRNYMGTVGTTRVL